MVLKKPGKKGMGVKVERKTDKTAFRYEELVDTKAGWANRNDEIAWKINCPLFRSGLQNVNQNKSQGSSDGKRLRHDKLVDTNTCGRRCTVGTDRKTNCPLFRSRLEIENESESKDEDDRKRLGHDSKVGPTTYDEVWSWKNLKNTPRTAIDNPRIARRNRWVWRTFEWKSIKPN